MRSAVWVGMLAACLGACIGATAPDAPVFRVATFNLENYSDGQSGDRLPKSSVSRAKIHESILALGPDVLSLQEVGGTNALLELRASLKREGLDFPYWEHVPAFDTNIQVAILSRFPLVARRSHTNLGFLLQGRRFQVTRGFAEVDIQVNSNYVFTLIGAHLKSRRQGPQADQAELRVQEARKLRQIIDARLSANPTLNLVVAGDLNDVKDAESTRTVIGFGRNGLIDTRPADPNGDNQPNPNPRFEPRQVTWTHYYGKEDTYSRIDYILLSPGMAKEWLKGETRILALPNWGVASDHRPVVVGFGGRDR